MCGLCRHFTTLIVSSKDSLFCLSSVTVEMWRILHAQFVRNISPRPDVNLTQESLIYQLRNNSEFKSKLKPMETIRISPDEEIIYKDFKEGNSVQVRVTVGPSDKDEFVKG